MSLESQEAWVALCVGFQLGLVHQLLLFLDRDILATMFHSLVTSRLDNVFYVQLLLEMVHSPKLQRVIVRQCKQYSAKQNGDLIYLLGNCLSS